MITLTQSVHVSLAYRYWNNQWSHDENRRRYGRLASIEGLGGNWRIEIGLRDGSEEELDRKLAQLKIQLDHRCLFTDLPAFIQRPATLENVTEHLAAELFASSERWIFLTIHENEHCSCTCRRDETHLSMDLKVMNLTLRLTGAVDEAGLMTSREQVTQSVMNAYAPLARIENEDGQVWADTVFQHLRREVNSLSALRVDLGQGRYIVVKNEESKI